MNDNNNPSFVELKRKDINNEVPNTQRKTAPIPSFDDLMSSFDCPLQSNTNEISCYPSQSNINESSRCPSLFGTTPLTQCQLTGPPSSTLVKDINESIVSVRGYERNNEKSEKGDKSEFRIVEETDVNFVDGMKKGKALMVEGYKFVYKSTRQLKDVVLLNTTAALRKSAVCVVDCCSTQKVFG